MSDPITHTLNASPWLVTFLTGAASLIFGLPLGTVITAAGGAYWAVYRNGKMSLSSSIFSIIAGMCIAAIMVEGVQWLVHDFLGFNLLPQRPLAFLLGFAVIDKTFRDKLTAIFFKKIDSTVKLP